jgi:hypothetical protein
LQPGAESLEVALFTEAEIPWDEIAFPVVRSTLEHFFTDLQNNRFPVRMFDVHHGEDRSISMQLISHSKNSSRRLRRLAEQSSSALDKAPL